MKPQSPSLIRTALRYVVYPAIDFIYAPICYYCQRTVQSGAYLCGECESWLVPLECDSEQHKSLRSEVFSVCRRIRDVYALYDFVPGGVLQELIHNLKYQQKTNIGVDLGKRIGEFAAVNFGMDDSWVLIPVPLHPSKERERGYNQSYYIARGIHSVTGAHVDTRSVRRLRKTRSQTKLTISERQENVSGAFTLQGKRLRSGALNVAVIDDVITTGSTVAELVSVLPDKLNVYAFSIAHAPLQVV